MDHHSATYYPALIESPLPESLRPEDIGPENWEQPVSIQVAPLPESIGPLLSGDIVLFDDLFAAVTITVDMFEQPVERQSEALVPSPASTEAFLVPLPDLDVPDQDALDLPIIRFPLPLNPNPQAQEDFLVPVEALTAVPDVRTLPVIRQPDPLAPNPQAQEQFLPVAELIEVITVDKWDQPPAIPSTLTDFPTPWYDGLIILSTLFGVPVAQDALTAAIRDFVLRASVRDLTLTADERDFTLRVEAP